jgi:hypothetical protein
MADDVSNYVCGCGNRYLYVAPDTEELICAHCRKHSSGVAARRKLGWTSIIPDDVTDEELVEFLKTVNG